MSSHQTPTGKNQVVRLATCLVALIGCHNFPQSNAPDLSAVRFYGYSEIIGVHRDSIAVTAIARNVGNKEVRIEISQCGPGVDINVYKPGAREIPVWTFDRWIRARRSAASSGSQNEGCLGNVLVTTLAPGKSLVSDRGALPIRIILGDSLPPGRYRIAIRSDVSGSPANFIPAGELDLHAPPTSHP